MLMSRDALTLSPPAPCESKFQSSFSCRCSGWVAVSVTSRPQKKRLWFEEALVIKTCLLWMQSCGGYKLVGIVCSRQACTDCSGRGTQFSKDSKLSISVDNPKLAHEEIPPAECQGKSKGMLNNREERAGLLPSLISKSEVDVCPGWSERPHCCHSQRSL